MISKHSVSHSGTSTLSNLPVLPLQNLIVFHFLFVDCAYILLLFEMSQATRCDGHHKDFLTNHTILLRGLCCLCLLFGSEKVQVSQQSLICYTMHLASDDAVQSFRGRSWPLDVFYGQKKM